MAREKRTFGWIQNPGRLTTLKTIVASLCTGTAENSYLCQYRLPLLLQNQLISQEDYDTFLSVLTAKRLRFSYKMLKGKGIPNGGKRSDALCSGLIQAMINAQKTIRLTDLDGQIIMAKKPYSDDWTADGYLRWGIALGLLSYHYDVDAVSVSELGGLLMQTEVGSEEEYDIFARVLLAYPPVVRILNLLKDGGHYSKFKLGDGLGFKGEMGFTSIPENFFIAEICTADKNNRSDIRSNEEGDADKYARGICSWLQKMEWVTTSSQNKRGCYLGQEYETRLQCYQITPKGLKALKRSEGYSSNPQIPKVVYFEMLATKAPDADFLRYRRALALQHLVVNRGTANISSFQAMYAKNNLEVSKETLADDLKGLVRIGLNIKCHGDTIQLKDKITNLVIQEEPCESHEISELKDKVRSRLKTLDHKYLVLIDLAYSDASKRKKNSDAREFEIETASLLVDELQYSGVRLGDSNRPDVVIWHETQGAIIDNKSYKDGFNLARNQADEMTRYIIQNKNRRSGEPQNEWWRTFPPTVDDFRFLFVTSFLKGQFMGNIISISTNTEVLGGAIGVDNLLYFAEDIKSGKMSHPEFFAKINNCEVVC